MNGLANLARRLLRLGESPNSFESRTRPSIDDFERSPLRFEMAALVEEYRHVRSQIQISQGHQHQIATFAIGLIVGLAAFAQLAPSAQALSSLLASYRTVYPVISLLFSGFALMYIEHDAHIATIGVYTEHYLRPRLEELIQQASGGNAKVWQWDTFRVQSQNRSKAAPLYYIMSASRYAVTVIPAAASLLIYLTSQKGAAVIPPMEKLLLGFAGFALLAVMAVGIHSALLYQGFPGARDDVRRRLGSLEGGQVPRRRRTRLIVFVAVGLLLAALIWMLSK